MLNVIAWTDETYGHILPDNCREKGTKGNGLIALMLLDEHLKALGIDVGSPEAAEKRIEMSADLQWRIPIEIHDRFCKCQEEKEPRNLNEALARADALIDKWGLPRKLNPACRSGVAYFAVAGGTKKSPVIYVRFYRGDRHIHACYRLKEKDWSLNGPFGPKDHCTYRNPGREIKNHEEAIAAAIEELNNTKN